MPARRPVRPLTILVICFAAAMVLSVARLAFVQMRLKQANLAYGEALLLRPEVLGALALCSCIATLIAFPIAWLLSPRLPLLSWIIDGALLPAYFLVSSKAMAFDLYVHDIYLVFGTRDVIMLLWATLSVPLVWLTMRQMSPREPA